MQRYQKLTATPSGSMTKTTLKEVGTAITYVASKDTINTSSTFGPLVWKRVRLDSQKSLDLLFGKV